MTLYSSGMGSDVEPSEPGDSLGIPEPEQEGGQGSQGQKQPVGGVGVPHGEPLDGKHGMKRGVGVETGSHGDLHSERPRCT